MEFKRFGQLYRQVFIDPFTGEQVAPDTRWRRIKLFGMINPDGGDDADNINLFTTIKYCTTDQFKFNSVGELNTTWGVTRLLVSLT